MIDGSSKVTATDVMASNGVVHLVDNVLVPPSLRDAVAAFTADAEPKPADKGIVELAVATESLSGLVGALTLPGQKAVLDALGGDGPFTVFAPTNGGFEALKTLKNADGVSLYDFVTKSENAAILTQILQYHVLSGKVEAAAAVDLAKANTEADTLLGEKISLSMSGDDLMIDGSSKVTATDVMASNGVVHLIDSVLVPPSLQSAVAGFTPQTPPPAPDLPVCPYSKDNACFDSWLYICEGCCESGMNSQGGSCWDAVYNSERCCKSTGAYPTVQTSPAQQYVCLFERDPTCFDWMYPCDKCCTSDLSITGGSCWDTFYTKSRCCTNSAVMVPQTVMTPVFMPPPPPVYFAPPVYTPIYGAPVLGGCQDLNPSCSIWALLGECQGAAAATTTQMCRLSCNACVGRRSGGAVGPAGGFVDSRNHGLGLSHDAHGAVVDSRGRRFAMPSDFEASSSDTSKTALIACLSAAALLAVLAVTVFVVVRYRRHRPSHSPSPPQLTPGSSGAGPVEHASSAFYV